MLLQRHIADPHYIRPHGHCRSVFLQEGEYTIRTLEDGDKIEAYRLRNAIFCKELGWVHQTQDELEVDEYDKHAVFLGVLNGQRKLVAFLRIILAERKFMIEKDFLALVDRRHAIRKEGDTAELSRLCVAPDWRKNKVAGNFGTHNVSILLFKGAYQWCGKNNIRFLYAVTELKIFKLLCFKDFPCKLIGKPRVMPDGLLAVAFRIDLEEWKAIQTLRSRKLLDWFNLV